MGDQVHKMTKPQILNAYGMTSQICKLPICKGELENSSRNDSCHNSYYTNSDGTYYNRKYDETTDKCTLEKIACLPEEKYPTCKDYKINLPIN